MSTSENVLRVICKHVAANYKDIVGIEIDQIEFHQNMDADFYENSLELIYPWVINKYPGIDIRGRKLNEDFLRILDEELLSRMMRKWAYIS